MSDPLRDGLQTALGTAYTLNRELGGGGMSRVFVAWDEALSRDIVVKVLAPELAHDFSAERFSREIRVAAALQDPHIVPVHSAGTTASGLPYYTMPFVRGSSLRERLDAGPVGVTNAIDILRDVARALAYAHEREIVHRDIKPENILLSGNSAIVTDFGIAKALELSRTQGPLSTRHQLTGTGTSLGTPAYMAPEQAAGDPDTDQRADIYAWGVIAYELLAGKHPFAHKTTPQQLLTAHMAETPASLATMGSQASRAVMELVMRCLEKDPARRPNTASQLVAALSANATLDGNRPLAASTSVRLAVGAVLLVAIAVLVWLVKLPDGDGRAVTASAAGPIMMAVLPFQHEGPDDQAPFTNGLTDAITAKLGGLRSLAVIDRRSAATYRGTTKPAKQIGSELGVKYLLGGVVRWEKDGTGVWQARVLPTLVDAATGITKWSGAPVAITLDDPFTAQGTIAGAVARELELVLRPEDVTRLARKLSDDPQAFAAYQRGRAIIDNAARSFDRYDPAVRERAIEEYERAVVLDSNFLLAWGELAAQREYTASLMSGNSDAGQRARVTLARAKQRAPNEPLVILTAASALQTLERDTVGVDSLVRLAVQLAPTDASVLSFAASVSRNADSAFALAVRAASLDPRSIRSLSQASDAALRVQSWADMQKYLDAIIAIDSADTRGWVSRFTRLYYLGDTIGMQNLYRRAMQSVPQIDVQLSGYMVVASRVYAEQFMTYSASQLKVASLFDSVWIYYDTKTWAALKVGNAARVRAYADSVVKLLTGRNLSGPDEDMILLELAFSYSVLDNKAEAHRVLERAARVASARSALAVPVDRLNAPTVAATYARIGEPSLAVRWLEAALTREFTVRSFLVDPRLAAFRTSPAFAQFLKAHPE